MARRSECWMEYIHVCLHSMLSVNWLRSDCSVVKLDTLREWCFHFPRDIFLSRLMSREENTQVAICVSFTIKCSMPEYQSPIDSTEFLAVFKTIYLPPPTPSNVTTISTYNLYFSILSSTSLRPTVSTATRGFCMLIYWRTHLVKYR